VETGVDAASMAASRSFLCMADSGIKKGREQSPRPFL
jgi:hypothetical protein